MGNGEFEVVIEVEFYLKVVFMNVNFFEFKYNNYYCFY